MAPSFGGMTTAALNARAVAAAAGPRPPLLTRPLLVRFVSVIGAETSFFLPLSVLPLYVRSSFGSGTGAGLVTGALLAACVAGELVTPRLVSRAGYRLSLAVGLVLLGAPALVLLWPVSLPVVVAANAVRGLGFAITTVAGGALTTSLIPADRRGEGLGLLGVVAGVPALVSLPAGVWAASRWGYGPVFAVTAAAALLALASVPGLPGRQSAAARRTGGVLGGLRGLRLLPLVLVFAAATVAAGVLVTFLPLEVSAATATAALFAQPAAATAARWAAGRIGDRRSHARLLRPGLLLSAAGMALLAAAHTPSVVVAGAACFGTGFGILQNATLAMMYARAPRSCYDAVSAIWNAAWDGGMGAGAAVIGLLAAATGYRVGFVITAVLVLPALVPASRERSRTGQPPMNAGSQASRRDHHGTGKN